MEDRLELQSRATEGYHDQIFEEINKLEEKKSEEALLLVQKKGLDLQHPFSSESWRSSTVDHHFVLVKTMHPVS